MNELLSPAKVAEALLSFAEEELDYGSFGEYINYYNANSMSWEIPELGTVTVVDHYNYDSDKNYDSWSEKVWIVFLIQGTLYRATGEHTSYTGTEWDEELKIVKPVEKTIIVFEDIA